MERIIPAESLKRLGRFDPEQKGCVLGWAMSGVKLRAACSQLMVEINCDYGDQSPWMGVLVDEAPMARFALRRGTHWYPVLSGMDAGCAHDISIVRDTQPVYGDAQMKVEILNISLDGDVLPLADKQMVIEFVGDSLTSGEGVVGAPKDAEWRLAYLSAMNTYAQLAAAELDAEGRWVSLSGWGVHCSWDAHEEFRIPAVYHQVCGADANGSAAYDFAQQPADVVVINLGTNDGTPMQPLQGRARSRYRKTFCEDTKAFLRQVRQCNPHALILWAYGMCGRPLEKEIRQAVAARREEGDLRVDYLRLPACPGEEIGSRQHPGAAYHRRAGKMIAEYIRAKLHSEENA